MLLGTTHAIGKVLSANDVGATGSNQVGILIPKDPRILSFFPSLNPAVKDPSVFLNFVWDHDGTSYEFRFVYYNGATLGASTRNEYRLTRMTDFFRESGMQQGDTIVLYRHEGQLHVSDKPPLGGVVPTDSSWAVVA